MTNLTIGQRIDVYEVVDSVVFDEDGIHHSYKIGTQLPAEYKYSHMNDPWPITPIFNGECLRTNEAVKCGYYLKVKSLKGVSNA